jgi:dolichol-phosphate mannosyltransferase
MIRAAARDPGIRYISFTRNFGHQAALRAGMRHAHGRAVIVMDADFEHPPELIPKLVAAWKSGAKIVATRRDDEGVAAGKRLSSQLYYRVLDAIGDVRIEPGSADYMLLDRAVVDVVNSLEDQDIFLRGLVRWLGFPLVTIPYARGQRQSGDSKFSLRRMVELALTGIAAHSVRPLRFAIWLALGFAILGAAQLLVLGIIGDYVGRILRETRKRPPYIVQETNMSAAPHENIVP